jgi:hypothetical protein
MNTVQSTAGVLNNIQNPEASSSDKTEAVVSLLENITPENADVIIAVVDEDFMMQQGFGEEYASQSASAFKVALKEMSQLNSEEHEAEAEKIKYVLDMVTNTDKNAYGEDGVFESVDDIISVAMDSKVAGAVIIDLAYDETGDLVIDALGIADSISNEDRKLISDALRNYSDEKKDTVSPEEYERINKIDMAICSLILGMK